MYFLEILAVGLFVVSSVLGWLVVLLLLGAKLGLYSLLFGISRDVGHEHDENGDCIIPTAVIQDQPRQWYPDGSHERID